MIPPIILVLGLLIALTLNIGHLFCLSIKFELLNYLKADFRNESISEISGSGRLRSALERIAEEN